MNWLEISKVDTMINIVVKDIDVQKIVTNIADWSLNISVSKAVTFIISTIASQLFHDIC